MNKIKIGKYTFFEEFWEIRKILLNFWEKKIKILDLWCWNWRHKILIKNIFSSFFNDKKQENSIKNNFIYFWIDEIFYKNQNCDIFFDWKIDEILEKILKKNKSKFDLIIANWIFENNLNFEIDILNKIFENLNKKSFVYLNFWNFWEDNFFRENDLKKVKNYVKKNIIPKIINSNFWENYSISYFEKEKNEWFNISIILYNS